MKKVLALIVLCFIAFNSHAQLRYQNGYLVYNAMERYNGYMTNWEGWAHCWKFGDRMIKFDLGPADSRVSSNSDKLVLYDTENGGFIDLYARNVYTNSDAASKTNIQSLGNAMATLAQLRPYRLNGPIRRIISRPADVRRVFPIPKKWDSLPKRSSRYFPTSWPWIARATAS